MKITNTVFAKSLLSLLISQSVFAADNPREIEEIIVTATKRATNLQDTPLAVSAFSQETLSENHVVNLNDLQGMVPSLHIAQNGTQNTPMVYMRGVGSSDQTESGDPAVAFHIDGIYSARSQGATALMYDLEASEILRGPQGTLFGRNSTGGVINLHTAKPADSFAASFEHTLGSYDRAATRAMLNVPINPSWAVRFAAATDNADGVVDFAPSSNLGEKYGSTDLTSYRLSSLFTPSDALKWLLTFENFNDKGTGHIPTLTGGSDRSAYIQVPGMNDYEVNSLRTRLDYSFNSGIMLSYIGGYTDSTRVSRWDRSWLPGNYEWGGCIECNHDATQHEIQVKNSDDADWKWMLGLFNFTENNLTHFDIVHPNRDTRPSGNSNPIYWETYRQPDRGLESNSVFGQTTYSFTHSLRGTLGARYTQDKRWDKGGRNIKCPSDPNTATPGIADNRFLAAAGQCWVDNINDTSPDWDKVTGMGRVEFDLNDDDLIYGSVATGFKSGTIQDGAGYSGVTPMNADALASVIATNNNEAAGTQAYINPEENINYELGFKGLFLEQRLQLFASLFSTRYTDLQVTSNITTATGADLLRKTNAGKATINGLELEANWLVGDAGRLEGSIALLDAKYDEFYTVDSSFGADGVAFNPSANNAKFPTLLNFSGNQLVQAPDLAFTLSYRHDFNLTSGGVLTPRLRSSYSSEVWFDPANRGDRPAGFKNLPYAADIDRQDAYFKWDTSLQFKPASADYLVEAFVDNLTDEEIKNDQGRWNSRAEPNFMWAPGRTFGVRVKVDFQ